MGIAADLLGTRPVLLSPNSTTGLIPRSQKLDLLPASVFEANVLGVAQNFQLGVLDGKMVIVRSNPEGGSYVLPTEVPAGAQPKQASEAAIEKFTRMLRAPSPQITNFLRASGALKKETVSSPLPPKPPKMNAFEANLTTGFIARQNGSNALTNVVELRNGKGEGSVGITYTQVTANNVGSKSPTLIPANSDSLSIKYGLNRDTNLIGGVSAVNSAGVQTTTFGLAVQSSFKLGDLTFSGDTRINFNPNGTVTFRQTVGVELTKTLSNGVYGKVSLAARVPWSIGSPAGGLQTAAFLGLGFKSNNFFVEAGMGTRFAGDAVNLASANGVVGGEIRIGITLR
jgi:hypothetical protein